MVLRRLVLCAALLPVACREPAHIDVRLQLECREPDLTTCGGMLLDCANFIEVRLYELHNGGPGNILRSRCISMEELGKPRDMCQLAGRHGPSLLTDLPEGQTVLFRLRALFVREPRNGCNDDIAGIPPPVLIFDGFSEAVPIDGDSHQATIHVNVCGGCRQLPRACTDRTCPLTCPPGTTPVSFPGDPDCCPMHCEMCNDPSCAQVCTGVVCPAPPQRCPDGSRPIWLRCCVQCAPPTIVGGDADAGVRD